MGKKIIALIGMLILLAGILSVSFGFWLTSRVEDFTPGVWVVLGLFAGVVGLMMAINGLIARE